VAKHSPKPWSYVTRRDYARSTTVVCKNGEPVADVWDDGKSHANSDLIIASPYLLEALELALSFFRFHGSVGDTPVTAKFHAEIMEQAIAKATGKET